MPQVKSAAQSITVIGRRWFCRGPGNTYHSAEIFVDGVCVHKIEFAYGYGEQYLWNARQWLSQNGYVEGIKNHANGSGQPLWDYCRERGISFAYSCSDVSRKRDL